MDVGFYLGELLMLRGEVKLPGLGNFSQIRMSAYYDENEALFYPPYNKVHFEPEADVEDDSLADYLVAKKRISLTSAKYFIEKYISNLRLQAIIADVPLGNMGYFYTDRGELSFKPVDKLVNDFEVYGYAPIKINKILNVSARKQEPAWITNFPGEETDQAETEVAEIYSETAAPLPENLEAVAEEKLLPFTAETIQPAIEEKPQPVTRESFVPFTTEKTGAAVTSIYEENFSDVPVEKFEVPVSPTYDEAFLDLPEEEEEERRGPLRAILITLVIIIVLALGVFALYTYAPDTFKKLQFWKNEEPVTPEETRPNTIVIPELDSLNTDTAKTALNDSINAVAPAADTVSKRFELITGKGFKNLWAAEKALKKYRAMGLTEAKFSEERPGKLIKISIASFSSISESEAMKQKLIKEGKLTKGAYTVENPQQ